jgi:Mg2+ and Co2+ transporter CorA
MSNAASSNSVHSLDAAYYGMSFNTRDRTTRRVSVVFLPLSLVAGIYGMNTEIPGLRATLLSRWLQ